jgi:hypothetical protein
MMLKLAMEYMGVIALVGLFVFVPITKMVLGAILTVVGAFFPTVQSANKKDEGKGKISLFKVAVTLSGGIRFAVIFAGVILLIGSILEGYKNYDKQKSELVEYKIDLSKSKTSLYKMKAELSKIDDKLERQQGDSLISARISAIEKKEAKVNNTLANLEFDK